MNWYARFRLLTAVLIFAANASALNAAGAYLDLPSHFYSMDSSSTALEFSLSDFNPDDSEASLFSASFMRRAGARSSVRLRVPYFSRRREDGVIFGFGDFLFNFTSGLIGDSLGTGGVYFRADFRLPTGSKDFYPYSVRSLDGGGGFEFRQKVYFLRLRGAATYTFVGERAYRGTFPYSNYILAAASADILISESLSASIAGHHARFKDLGERWVINIFGNISVTPTTRVSIYGGFETGDREHRIFDAFIAAGIAFRFPAEEPEQVD